MADDTKNPDWKLLISGGGLALSLLGSYGAYKVQQATVEEHTHRLEKLEVAREEEQKQHADLDKRQTVSEAQLVAILASLARVESKIDALSHKEK